MIDNILCIFPYPSLHISVNKLGFSIASENSIVLLTKEGKKIYERKRCFVHSTLLLNNYILVKKNNGEYGVYNYSTDTYKLLTKNQNGIAENTYPILLPDNIHFIDYSFFSPQKQLFSCNITDGSIEYLEYSSMSQVISLSYDPLEQVINMIDQNTFIKYHYPDFQITDRKAINVTEQIVAYYTINHTENIVIKTNFGLASLNVENNSSHFFENSNIFMETGVLYRAVISKTQKYMAVVFSNQTVIYNLLTGDFFCSYLLKSNWFAEFTSDDNEILLGTGEYGCCVNISKNDMLKTFDLTNM